MVPQKDGESQLSDVQFTRADAAAQPATATVHSIDAATVSDGIKTSITTL